jgi:hypothetical protein
MNNQAEIYDALNLLSIILNQPQESKRLEFYAVSLKDFEPGLVLSKIKSMAYTSIYFPQLKEIMDSVKGLNIPTDEIAVIWANEIVDSFYRCGTTSDAEKTLGEKYQLVARMGGWEQLSRSDNGDMSTIKAQIRELAKAYINRSKRDAIEIGESFKLDTSPRSISETDKKQNGLKLIKF